MLCLGVFAVMTVLCVNVLTTSYSTMGSASQKYISAQTYYLSTSLLDVVSHSIEDGTFNDQIASGKTSTATIDLPDGRGSAQVELSFKPLSGDLYARLSVRFRPSGGSGEAPYTAYGDFMANGDGWILKSFEGGDSYVARNWDKIV